MNPDLSTLLAILHQPRRARPAALILALLVSLPFSTMAHSAPQGSTELYEGLTVSRIDLVVPPTMNPDSFRPLVAQKTGMPYSSAEIQKSVAALQATGRFTKVDVEVRPEQEGLRVTFITEPAYYLGVISFPGASAVFSYSRLLQAVNYPQQEPFEADRARHGESALTTFFTQQGFFMAKVKMETKLHDNPKLVDIIYNVTLGRRAKFGEIQFSGPPPIEAEQLKASLHSFRAHLHAASIKEGNPFSADRLQAATRFLQEYLGSHNHLANRVRMAKPAYNPATNRAALRWEVTLGATVQVRVAGASISQKTLKTLIPIYEENSFDQDLVEEGKRNLISYFQGKGFFDVKVNPQTTTGESQISLVYQVDRGTRHRVASVQITGNHHFQDSDLRNQVVVKKGLFLHGTFSNDLVTRSVNNLTAYYHNAGYQDVRVHPQVEEHGETIDVMFHITEGDLTRVGALNLEGNATQTLAKLAPKGLILKAGQPYSQSRLDKDRSQILASYLELGYPNATLKSSVEPSGENRHSVIVTFHIDEGPHVTISEVAFMGQAQTKLAFLEHNTEVKAEAPLSEDKILESESKLYNLGIFDWASVAPRRPITDQQNEDVLVKVHEAKRNSITYGFGVQYTPVDGSFSSGIVALPGLPTLGLPSSVRIIEKNIFSPLGSFDYTRLNLLGRAETATVGTFLSLLDQRLSFRYTDPQFLGLNWSSLLNVSAERTAQNPLFTARLGSASFQLEKILDKARTKRLQLRYSFQRTSLTNLLIQNFIPPQDESVQSSMVSATFIRDTRDKPLDAHRGFFQTLDVGISPEIFGSTDNFARFFGQTAYYRQMNPWLVWANNVRVGLVDSFAGSHVPFSERFFSGGADSLRGFPLNGAGPQVQATLCTKANDPTTCTTRITAPTGGHQLFIFNSEGRFPLPIYKNLGGVVFYDGGNVYNTIGFTRFFSGYSNSVGLGLRYQTPIGPIRIDVGRNLSPVPGLKATQLFISLGQSF